MNKKLYEFIRGNASNPTGNLLIFAFTDGFNPISLEKESDEVIICNVIISFVAQENDHYPVIAFPPTTLSKRRDLELLMHLNPNYDVFKMESFTLTPDQDIKTYLRLRIRQFNHTVAEYIDMCKNYISEVKLNLDKPSVKNFLSNESKALKELFSEDLIKNKDNNLTNKKNRKNKKSLDLNKDLFSDFEQELTNNLMSSLTNNKNNLFEKKFNSEHNYKEENFASNNIQEEEILCLKHLEKCVELHEKEADNRSRIYLQRIINFIESKYPLYDVKNLARAIDIEFSQNKDSQNKNIEKVEKDLTENPIKSTNKYRNKENIKNFKKNVNSKIKINTLSINSKKELVNKYNRNIRSKVEVKIPNLTKLYLMKFRAIQAENYEQAAKLQNKINKIEKYVC